MSKLKSPWKSGVTIAITLFILAWLVIGTKAEAKTIFGVSAGATFVGGEQYESETIMITETLDDKYELGIALMLRLACTEDSECARGEYDSANQLIFVQRVVRYKAFQMGIGVGYSHNKLPTYNTHTPFILSMRYDLTGRLSVGYFHESCGGSCTSNSGKDMIYIGYSF